MGKTMLEILKDRLPEGLGIECCGETNSKYKITLGYKLGRANVELSKSCPPDSCNEVADRAIITAMSTILVNNCELEKAKEWLDKLYKKEGN